MTTAVALVGQPSTAPAVPQVPYEVWDLAGQTGILPVLYKNLKLAERLFPGRAVRVSQESDPELRGARYIVFRVDVEGWDTDKRHAAYQQWLEEKAGCPDLEKAPFMSLAMESTT